MYLAKKIAVLITLAIAFIYCIEGLSSFTLEPSINAQENKTLCVGKYNETVSIFSASSLIELDNPFILSVTINNKLEEKLPLKYYPHLILRRVDDSRKLVETSEDGFYGKVYFEPDSDFMRKDVLVQGESINFDIDITKLKWGARRSAFTPNDSLFKTVPKGDYTLYLELQIREPKENSECPLKIISNNINVTVK